MYIDKVRYKNKYYGVIKISYKDTELPLVIDWDDVRIIDNLNKRWRYSKNGFVSCNHVMKNKNKEVFIHELIMALKKRDLKEKRESYPIIHINRIGLDNRRDNLIYDKTGKEINKNVKKKKRTITLPVDSGISVDDIPTYVWYMKPNGSHGDRFMVDIGDIKWKTTSSKKLSLGYKLEEAKKYLRELKDIRPDLFQEYSMNGDFNKDGKNLVDSYYDIIYRAGYDHMNRYSHKNNTNLLLKSSLKSRKERKLLKETGNLVGGSGQKRRTINTLPKDCGITSNDLPSYCYYRPPYNGRGEYFIVENHPKQKNKFWQTTTSKNVSINEKYEDLLDYIETL